MKNLNYADYKQERTGSNACPFCISKTEASFCRLRYCLPFTASGILFKNQIVHIRFFSSLFGFFLFLHQTAPFCQIMQSMQCFLIWLLRRQGMQPLSALHTPQTQRQFEHVLNNKRTAYHPQKRRLKHIGQQKAPRCAPAQCNAHIQQR